MAKAAKMTAICENHNLIFIYYLHLFRVEILLNKYTLAVFLIPIVKLTVGKKKMHTPILF